jgi:hypothetical protein
MKVFYRSLLWLVCVILREEKLRALIKAIGVHNFVVFLEIGLVS